jgi:hypothetical protein
MKQIRERMAPRQTRRPLTALALGPWREGGFRRSTQQFGHLLSRGEPAQGLSRPVGRPVVPGLRRNAALSHGRPSSKTAGRRRVTSALCGRVAWQRRYPRVLLIVEAVGQPRAVLKAPNGGCDRAGHRLSCACRSVVVPGRAPDRCGDAPRNHDGPPFPTASVRGDSTAGLRRAAPIASKQERGPRMARSRAAPSGIADPKRSLWSCVAGS